MKAKHWIAGAVVVLAAVIFIVVNRQGGQRELGKALVYCSEGSPEGFTPAFFTSGTTIDASAIPIYDTLVYFKSGTTELVPSLAESWLISSDGLTYTFKLRPGVKFHTTDEFTPSRDLNADDVIFSFMRQHDDAHPWHNVGDGSYEYYISNSLDTLIDSIEKIDDLTVQFHLTRPEAPLISMLGMPFTSIHSAEYAEQMMSKGTPEQFDVLPVGTGPFQLLEYVKDSTIVYGAFDAHWRGRAKLDTLIFSITSDKSTAFQKLQAGECHLIPYPNSEDLQAIIDDENIVLQQSQGLNVGYLAFNTEKAPFDNVFVRRALSHAIDKKAIVEAVFNGTAFIAKNPIPPGMWSYNDDIEDLEYNPELARRYLELAGVENLKTDVWAMPVARPYNPDARRMAELIQEDWRKVGVEANIFTTEWGDYLSRSSRGDHETVLLGWTADYGDPDNFLYVLLGCDAARNGANRARWCYPPFDDLLRQAKQTSDVNQRTALYEQAQVLFKQEAPWVTLVHSTINKPVRKEVQGFVMSPLGYHDFYPVDLIEEKAE